jgi:hypothetical protein
MVCTASNCTWTDPSLLLEWRMSADRRPSEDDGVSGP